MNKIRLFVLALLAATILSCSSSDDRAPQKIGVVLDDVPYPTEKFVHIGYTLKTWEFEKENLELQKIVVLDAESKVELLVIEKANLPLMYKDPLPTAYNLYTGKLDSYYISIQLPIPLGQAPPRSVSHRLVFNNTTSARELIVEGAQFMPRTNETPLAVTSPLKGKNLRYFNQSTIGYHFYSLFLNNGTLFNSPRYAFDSLQYNDDMTAYYQGDPNQNISFYNYGSTIYSVADGVVVSIKDGLPEQNGMAYDLTLNSAEELSGNNVVINIGGGRYAFYAHCQPESFGTLHVGDMVKEGQAIAKLGNSGNSHGPHLHFQITDGPNVFFSRGIPFVLKGYTKTGELGGTPDLSGGPATSGTPVAIQPTLLLKAIMESTTIFSVE
jgi:murein DD-endopeptidase MepM/ murein hydrolase activator NlpD